MPTEHGRGRRQAAALALLVIVAGCTAPVGGHTSPAEKTPASREQGQASKLVHQTGLGVSDGCDQELWQHVYHPSRLHVVTPCLTVTGTIALIRRERDGDYHILLHVDPAYESLLNERNLLKQRGDLVIEPICEHRVMQDDAIPACEGFDERIPIPQVGSHVAVTGAYVLDSEHGWMEIHPVTSFARPNGHSQQQTPRRNIGGPA